MTLAGKWKGAWLVGDVSSRLFNFSGCNMSIGVGKTDTSGSEVRWKLRLGSGW